VDLYLFFNLAGGFLQITGVFLASRFNKYPEQVPQVLAMTLSEYRRNSFLLTI